MEKRILQECKACENDISRHSLFCRHCGHPQAMTLAIWLFILFLLLLTAFYIAFCVYGVTLIK